MQIEIRENYRELDFEDVIGIYLKNGWGKRRSEYSADKLKHAFQSTSYVVAAFRDGRLEGWCRALSDDVTNTWIMEVVVDPECQRQGLGRHLVEAVRKRYSHTAIWAETYAPTRAFGEKCGLTPRDGMVVISRGPESRCAEPIRSNL